MLDPTAIHRLADLADALGDAHLFLRAYADPTQTPLASLDDIVTAARCARACATLAQSLDEFIGILPNDDLWRLLA